MLRQSLALLILLTAACTDPDGDDGSTSEATAADESGGGVDVPTGQAALSPWLMAENYAGWAAESAVHAATGTSPHGMVRTFFDDVLVASFEAGNTEHTVGSASVKELYDAGGTRVGWAVMVKTAAGTDASNWYWYLESNGSASTDANGAGLCEGCHAPGVDRVLTPYPLQ
ncbi:hypothetical protein [Paraliomyxa miuraensis]|uniref:hypothetical protein n=1 Tax=Paraliomyxa miuraensis TaxID=376150 RepID=UPI00225B236E|nr:hypothetical protein [Paraliomyxa miuraensis]MCX4244561.1 hypothetical protein [Paraliomyxa miuraensis]